MGVAETLIVRERLAYNKPRLAPESCGAAGRDVASQEPSPGFVAFTGILGSPYAQDE
jgi:hypothetical protein